MPVVSWHKPTDCIIIAQVATGIADKLTKILLFSKFTYILRKLPKLAPKVVSLVTKPTSIQDVHVNLITNLRNKYNIHIGKHHLCVRVCNAPASGKKIT